VTGLELQDLGIRRQIGRPCRRRTATDPVGSSHWSSNTLCAALCWLKSCV